MQGTAMRILKASAPLVAVAVVGYGVQAWWTNHRVAVAYADGQGQQQQQKPKKQLVIVGMGPTGVAVLSSLVKNQTVGLFDIVVVEPRDMYHHAIGAPRTLVDPNQAQRILMPYSSLLSKAGSSVSVVAGRALQVTEGGVTVALNEGGTKDLSFDYMVVGLGTTIPFPGGWTDDGTTSSASMIEKYQELQKIVAGAQKIVIIGGGAVGVELAGEIATGYRDKSVTIVNSGARLLANEDVSDKFTSTLQEKVRRAGITVHNGVRATVMSGESKVVRVDRSKPYTVGPVEVQLSDESVLEADLVLYCTGAKTNSQPIAGQLASKLDEHYRLKVTPTLQVEDFPAIFAGGDICNTAEAKQAMRAGFHGELIAKNLAALAQGQALAKYRAMPSIIFVPIGKADGVGQLPLDIVVGSWIVPMVKGKDLMVDMVRKRSLLME